MRNLGRVAFACLLLLATSVHAAGNADVVGVWNLEFKEGDETIRPTLTVSESGGALAATWKGPRGTTEPKDVRYADGVLRFTLVRKVLFSETEIQFEAKVEGDRLSGTLTGPRGATPVAGKR